MVCLRNISVDTLHKGDTEDNNSNNNNNNNKAECKQLDETVEHIIPARPILATEQYIQRHDTVCVELHC